MARRSKGSRLKLFGFDQDLIERIEDFREAYLDASENTVVAEAARSFIKAQTENNPDILRRYTAARQRRRKTL
jgi:hypothetical protein